MKLLSIVIIFSILTAGFASYSFNIPAKIGLPGLCLYHGMRLQPGSNPMLHKCQIVQCMEDGSMKVEGCDQKPCRSMDATTTSMTQLPYPQCCTMCKPNYHGVPSPMGRFMYKPYQQPYPFMAQPQRQQHYYYTMHPEYNMEMF